MTSKKVEAALRQIAENNDLSIADVRREIELAIKEVRENPDPNVQAFWEGVPHRGDKPTIEEVISHMAGIIAEA